MIVTLTGAEVIADEAAWSGAGGIKKKLLDSKWFVLKIKLIELG